MFWGEQHALQYDQRNARFAPFREALHLLMRATLGTLAPESRVLCVGAGTGAELLYLAHEFPSWRFTAVEPAPAMLKICRQRCQEAGIAARCTFHEGFLDSLPEMPACDAATALLVSHFLVETSVRRDFFRQIAGRLRPQAVLVQADLAAAASPEQVDELFEMWIRLQIQSGSTPAEAEGLRQALAENVALTPTPELEALVVESGFTRPLRFLQAGLIHAWTCRRL